MQHPCHASWETPREMGFHFFLRRLAKVSSKSISISLSAHKLTKKHQHEESWAQAPAFRVFTPSGMCGYSCRRFKQLKRGKKRGHNRLHLPVSATWTGKMFKCLVINRALLVACLVRYSIWILIVCISPRVDIYTLFVYSRWDVQSMSMSMAPSSCQAVTFDTPLGRGVEVGR